MIFEIATELDDRLHSDKIMALKEGTEYKNSTRTLSRF